MSDNPDVPEIPAHISARKALPLTAETATLLGENKYMDTGGKIHGAESSTAKRASAAAITAEAKARKYAGPYPLQGLTPAEIDTIRGKQYEDRDQPKMAATLGDRTPEWVNWLWAKYPWDAAKRLGGTREIWPSKLPASWPPIPDVGDAPAENMKAAAAPAGRLYTQAEVDAMIARTPATPLPEAAAAPAPKPKRIRNRSKKPAQQPESFTS